MKRKKIIEELEKDKELVNSLQYVIFPIMMRPDNYLRGYTKALDKALALIKDELK